MRVTAELDLRAFDRQMFHVMPYVALVAVNDTNRVGRHHGDFMIGQIDDLFSAPCQGRTIAGNKVLSVANANYQGLPNRGRDDNRFGPISKTIANPYVPRN